MTTTTYYGLNIAEGTDIVNPLTVDNPNYEKIDEVLHNNAVTGVTLATEITTGTVHAIVRENSDCSVIRFIATSKWKSGDSVTVDGVPVIALLPSGETLPDGAYVINANVLCVLTGTNLTVYVGKKAENANEIAFNDTTVGAELVRLNEELVRQDAELVRQDGKLVELEEKIDNVSLNGTILWNNPNYILEFPAQTVNLVDDLINYNYIEVYYANSNSNDTIMTTGRLPLNLGTASLLTDRTSYRTFAISSSGNTLNFNAGNTSTASSNVVCIPRRIIGYK